MNIIGQLQLKDSLITKNLSNDLILENLPDDIILEIFKKVIFTYHSFIASFTISKKINIMIKTQCELLDLGGLILCTDKCKYSVITNYLNPNWNYRVEHQSIGKSGRKYNDVHTLKYSDNKCMKHHSTGINQWTCNKCEKIMVRPDINIMSINISPYRHNKYELPTIEQSLDRPYYCSNFRKNIFQNVKKESSNLHSARMINREYYWWKGNILQGIENLKCCAYHGPKTFEADCVICDYKFHSTYYGKSPQLCEKCLNMNI